MLNIGVVGMDFVNIYFNIWVGNLFILRYRNLCVFFVFL